MSSRFNKKFHIEYFALIIGLALLIFTIINLLKFPDSFFLTYNHGRGKFSGIPLPITTVVGWIMLAHGIISIFRWTEKNWVVRVANSFPKVRKWHIDNKVFLVLTILFLNLIFLIYIVMRLI